MTNKLFGASLIGCAFLIFFSCTKEVIDISTPDPLPTDTTDTSAISFCDTITYGTHITDFLNTHCTTCHVAGGSGPGDFTNYSEIKSELDQGDLEEKVFDPNTGSPMPPGEGLTTEEKDRLQCWIDAGGPNN